MATIVTPAQAGVQKAPQDRIPAPGFHRDRLHSAGMTKPQQALGDKTPRDSVEDFLLEQNEKVNR
jgi:hypothetical protein